MGVENNRVYTFTEAKETIYVKKAVINKILIYRHRKLDHLLLLQF